MGVREVAAATSSIQIFKSDGAAIIIGKLSSFKPNVAKGGVQHSDDLVKATQKLYPNKAGKIELHHPIFWPFSLNFTDKFKLK